LLLLPGSASAQLDRTGKLLEELSNAFGPSGYEADVRAIMRRELAPFTNSIETDGLGSLIAAAKASPDAPRIMMAAHMDELGMIVRYITPEGYIKFVTLGGWLDQGLINQRYWIKTRKGMVLGVTGLKTPHIMQGNERSQLKGRDEIFVDVGAKSKQDAEERLGIRPGDPIGPDSKFAVMNGGALYVGKAWDDRVGCAVMVEVMRKLKASPAPASVYAVATVQEEIGLRGARTSAYGINAQSGIAVDVDFSIDHPGVSKTRYGGVTMGKGPSVCRGANVNPNVFRMIRKAAEELKIEVQVAPEPGGTGTDGNAMQISRAGMATGILGVPLRYMHTPCELLSLTDVEQTAQVMAGYCRQVQPDTDFTPRLNP